jgi:hypothetical protein
MNNKENWNKIFCIQTKEVKNDNNKIKHVVGVLSPIFNKWSGSILKRSKRKRKRVGGKRVDTSEFSIFPPLGVDIINEFN